MCSQFFSGCIMLRPFNVSLLCLAFFRYLNSEGVKMGYNCLAGLGLVEKTVYFLK